jgi:photosystem II stability/assembly factor-like uncharacterized protein
MRSFTWWTLALLAIVSLTVPRDAVAAWRPEGPPAATVTHIAIAPSQPETVYAATNDGGVWRSSDGGATWSLPGDEMTSRNVRWVTVDPADPKSVWAGIEASGRGSALWRTTDGGVTWKPVNDEYPGGRVQATGAPIAFSPAQPRTIYVASTNHHYRTDDGGKTWRDFRVPNQDVYVFAVHPTDPKIVFAGGRGETQNVSRSTDGGKTWRQVGVGLGKNSLHHLLIDPTNPTTLYASGGTFAAIFKSTDRGDTWEKLTLPVGGTSHLYDLALDPKNGERLWAATEDGLLVSTDGGASWTRSDNRTGRYLVAAVAVDPRDSSHLLAGTGGEGVFVSRDGGASWAPSGSGLAAGWVKRLWGDARSATLFAQLSTGLYRRDANGAWAEVTDPFTSEDKAADIDGILFDAGSPQVVYAFDTSKYWRSTDGGRRWQEAEQKGPSMRDMMKGNTDSAQFASMAQDAGNPKILYAGSWSNDSEGGAVYKTTDAGRKWTPSGRGLPAGRVGVLVPGGPGTVFAVVGEGGVFRTTDGGGRWIAAGSGLPDAKVRTVVVNPKSPAQLFAATEKGLFRSTDAGASWSQVGASSKAGLENEDVEAVAFDQAAGTVYAGTFHGVFRSADGGDTWTPLLDGLVHRDVRALVVAGAPARLWAGTAGGSVYSIALP